MDLAQYAQCLSLQSRSCGWAMFELDVALAGLSSSTQYMAGVILRETPWESTVFSSKSGGFLDPCQFSMNSRNDARLTLDNSFLERLLERESRLFFNSLPESGPARRSTGMMASWKDGYSPDWGPVL